MRILPLTLISVRRHFLGFAYHDLTHRGDTLFDLRIFRDKNFTASSLLIAAFGLGLYGMMVLQPMMLESLYRDGAHGAPAAKTQKNPLGISRDCGRIT